MTIHTQGIGLILVLATLAFVLFLIPFFSFHKGLPTGDSQKSIIWAQDILRTGKLPDYQTAVTRLNRDPVDFYTPVLHIFTAGLLKIGGLTAVGIAAIIISIATAIIGSCLAYHFLPTSTQKYAPPLAFLLILTQERFLRYVREPGYHFQNIVGEFLLFSILLLSLSLIRRWSWSAFLSAVALTGLLALSHQFSMFLAAFVLLPLAIASIIKSKKIVLALAPIIAIFIITGLALGLHHKIPDIFSASPHLLNQTPGLIKVFELMGPAWLLLGLAGATLLWRESNNLATRAFIISAAVLFLLSFAPVFHIDIPPVRALLYSAVPLSITGAYLLARQPILILPVIFFATLSTTNALTLSHSVRTNSTLTSGELELVKYIDGGTLVDDYDRRSSSWLVLSGQPMFTRVAADLETQMNESQQSSLRRQLYLNQLDFEKIFSLGSLPEITQLMGKHRISYLTGIDGSSQSSFAHNPALQEARKIDDITIFTSEVISAQSDWLLKPSTLANDIGDLEDTFEHLPASLRATRLSDPQIAGSTTFRTTNAPLIPLKFNIGDYVRILWDTNSDHQPDSTLELLIKYLEHTEVQKITPRDAHIDEDGFITLTIRNPEQKILAFDLIALGLSQTP